MTFVDFDCCHRMVSTRQLYSVIVTYFLKVNDSNRDLPTLANAHTNVTSNAVLRATPEPDAILSIQANVHSSVTSASSSRRTRYAAFRRMAASALLRRVSSANDH